uniref:Reverse transcriptase domain-containing protein n=1 Tax=Tanacetum cinerariifolium TaxID=118510 RepID=A0A6L2JB91_TANCI|nr:reverse transcriptase domain-containing protein [Tanacetum cinerariifolium]
MAPTRRTTRASPATTTTTIPFTNAQLKALIDQGVANALAALENQVKFATCTLHSIALTWWKSHVKTVGQDAADSMPWGTLMKTMTAKYCPRNKIKKLDIDIWELKVKGIDVTSYTQRFQELALMCGRMLPEEFDKIEKYVGGLPDIIHGSVMASKPKTMQDAVEFATELMDKKIHTFFERQIENKKKQDDNQQSLAATNNQRNLTCYECGNQGHYRSDFPELKNQNHGNQAGGTRACRMVHALGGGENNQDLNNMKDDINA